jgi:hypothetical protein
MGHRAWRKNGQFLHRNTMKISKFTYQTPSTRNCPFWKKITVLASVFARFSKMETFLSVTENFSLVRGVEVTRFWRGVLYWFVSNLGHSWLHVSSLRPDPSPTRVRVF